jgi:hypothetical protein
MVCNCRASLTATLRTVMRPHSSVRSRPHPTGCRSDDECSALGTCGIAWSCPVTWSLSRAPAPGPPTRSPGCNLSSFALDGTASKGRKALDLLCVHGTSLCGPDNPSGCRTDVHCQTKTKFSYACRKRAISPFVSPISSDQREQHDAHTPTHRARRLHPPDTHHCSVKKLLQTYEQLSHSRAASVAQRSVGYPTRFVPN